MSSPFIASTNSFPDRFIASSPGPRNREVMSPQEAHDVSVRSMKRMVKFTPRRGLKTNRVVLSESAIHI